MKMHNSFLCCDTCFEHIGKHCVRSAKLWIDLCALDTFENDFFDIHFEDENCINLLETLGFIISTEVDDLIRIKVVGRKKDTIGLYFCPRGCEAKEVEDEP